VASIDEEARFLLSTNIVDELGPPIEGANTIATPPGINVAAIILAGSDRLAARVVTGVEGGRRTTGERDA
jgi:hypothetical protein